MAFGVKSPMVTIRHKPGMATAVDPLRCDRGRAGDSSGSRRDEVGGRSPDRRTVRSPWIGGRSRLLQADDRSRPAPEPAPSGDWPSGAPAEIEGRSDHGYLYNAGSDERTRHEAGREARVGRRKSGPRRAGTRRGGSPSTMNPDPTRPETDDDTTTPGANFEFVDAIALEAVTAPVGPPPEERPIATGDDADPMVGATARRVPAGRADRRRRDGERLPGRADRGLPAAGRHQADQARDGQRGDRAAVPHRDPRPGRAGEAPEHRRAARRRHRPTMAGPTS